MESLTMHDLTAAYALGALDATESRQYEDHLATCEVCREQLAELGEAASALAFAVESPAPPEALRSQILASARAERPNVVPLRSRRTAAITAIAAVACCGRDRTGDLGRPRCRTRSIGSGARGRRSSVCSPIRRTRESASAARTQGRSSSDATTTRLSSFRGLERAPSGRTYEAWVIKDNKPVRAGTFSGGRATTVVPLEHQVPSGSIVAVTLEREPGADAPHGKILLHSESA
jgi:anti-sigma-K factor RskA